LNLQHAQEKQINYDTHAVNVFNVSFSPTKRGFTRLLKIDDYKPNFIWWHENQTDSVEKYTVRFTKIQEFFGSDTILDNKDELGGISYNLLTSEWDTTIKETYNDVTVNLTLSGLANNVVIQFILHVSTTYNSINYSGELIKPLEEAQIDIFVNNWQFSTGAQGLAIKSEVYDQANVHEVLLLNNSETLHNMDSLVFGSYTGYDLEKAYYNWVDHAGFVNDTIAQYPSEIDASFFNETTGLPGEDELVHMWFSYPNDIDPVTISHTIILGLYEINTQPPTNISGYQSYWIIGTIGLINILVIIYRKRAKK